MPLRFTARKPEVVSVTRCRTSRLTSQENSDDPDPPRERRSVAGRRRRTASRPPCRSTPSTIGSISLGSSRGVVLSVAVDLHREVETVIARVLIAGLHRAADAEIEREPDDVASARTASAAVPSVEPSSITMTRISGSTARISSTTDPIDACFVVRGDDGEAAERLWRRSCRCGSPMGSRFRHQDGRRLAPDRATQPHRADVAPSLGTVGTPARHEDLRNGIAA